MSGKRSSQRNIELSDQCETKMSKLRTSRIAESKVSEAVSQKHPTESILEDFDRKIQLYGEVPDNVEEKMSLVDVDDSFANPGKVMYSEDNPAFSPAAHSRNKNYLLKSQKENNNVGRKTKKEEQCSFPCRSSKQPVITLCSGKLTHQLENGGSAAGDASRCVGTRSGNIVYGASQHVGASSEADDFFDTLEDISYLSDESLNNDIMLLDEQVVSNDHHHKPDTVENSEMLRFRFRDVPCFDFAYKILTGELPIDYEPPCQGEPLNEIEKSHENQASTEDKPQALGSENASVKTFDKFMFPILPNAWSDSEPFFGIAFQSLKEDDLFRGYFQQNHVTLYNEVSTPAPPVFFPCDITPQFDTAGAYVPVFPENAYWPPAENVTKPLSVNSSSQRAASEGFSNGNGIGSDEQI